MFTTTAKTIAKTAILAALIGGTTLGAAAQTYNQDHTSHGSQPTWNEGRGAAHNNWHTVSDGAGTGLTIRRNINAADLRSVSFDDGMLEETGNGEWVGRSLNGSVMARFIRVQLEPYSLQLLNEQKGIYLEINLLRRTIRAYGSRGEEYGTKYIQSTTMKRTPNVGGNTGGLNGPTQPWGQNGGQIGNAVSTHTVSYTCNAGIPLIVRYETIGNNSFAYASHDSFPEIKLFNVRAGSGVQYANGNNMIHSKGNSIYLNFNGIEDSCYQQ